MTRFHEAYGRQAELLMELQDYFQRTQALLSQLLEGTVEPSRLVVTQTGWDLKEPDEDPPA